MKVIVLCILTILFAGLFGYGIDMRVAWMISSGAVGTIVCLVCSLSTYLASPTKRGEQ